MTDKLNDNDRQRIEQEANRTKLPYSYSTAKAWFKAGAEYATIYEREQQQLPTQKDEPDWNKLAALKPPENLGGVYHGCWLEGAAQGYSKCMITIVAEWRRRYYQSEVVKKELEAERSELIEKMTELLKAFNDSDKNYADWVATKELYSAFTGVNNLLERLNSLKTK